MNFDDILEHVGDFGGYQRLLVCLLYFPAIFAGLQALSYVFISATPRHRCFVETCDNDTTTYADEDFLGWSTPYSMTNNQYSQCELYSVTAMNKSSPSIPYSCSSTSYIVDHNITDQCHRWKFDKSIYEHTVVTQWDLVCDRSRLVALSQSVYMVGIMMGSIVFGNIADRYGRKTAMMFAMMIAATAATAVPFVQNYSLYLTLKLIIGASGQGFYQTIFVMSMEMVGKSKRAFCGLLVSIYFSIGEILLGVLAFYVRDWRVLQLIISLPLFLFISYIWIIPESPRWMISKKRFSGAKRVLEKIAFSNNRTVPYDLLNVEDSDLIIKQHSDSLSQSMDKSSVTGKAPVQHSSMASLFQTSRLRWRTINIAFNWFMNTVAYYGITMSTPNLGGNEFFSFVMISAIEIPAYVFSILVIDRVGRRIPLCSCMVIGGLAGTATYFIPSSSTHNEYHYWLSIGLALLAKFGASAAFGIIYVFTAELFPTVVRNNGIGLSSMIGHIGGVIAPYIATMSVYNPAFPLLIYGSFSLIAGITALTLPETLNQKLPDTLQDAEDFGRIVKRVREDSCGSDGRSERFYLLSDNQDDDEIVAGPT